MGPFWGCSEFPKCRATLNDIHGKPSKDVDDLYRCPLCTRRLVRAAPEKGDYWFCSGYSKGCKATVSDCTRVGLAKASVNHACVQGWNNANAFDSAATRVAADSACAVLVFAMSPSTAPGRGWTYGFALSGGSRYSTLSADYGL